MGLYTLRHELGFRQFSATATDCGDRANVPAGTQALGTALTRGEQVGFADAAVFSLQWNKNGEFVAKGAAVAAKDHEVTAECAKAPGAKPGARCEGEHGTRSWRRENSSGSGPDGRQGFNASLPFMVQR